MIEKSPGGKIIGSIGYKQCHFGLIWYRQLILKNDAVLYTLSAYTGTFVSPVFESNFQFVNLSDFSWLI